MQTTARWGPLLFDSRELMPSPHNMFKKALREGRTQIGLWLTLANPYCAELCATGGFDWLLVDSEHAPNDLRSILAQLQAIAAYPSAPVVRISNADPVLIKQVLEIGATTIMTPLIESADQAGRIARAMRYPPRGTRGVGSGLARSSRWSGHADYLKEADDEVCLLVQVETVAALSALEDIATMSDVDGIFIGPADLAAAMGHLGEPTHPQVQSAIESAIRRVRACGKPVGIYSPDRELLVRYLELGISFAAVGADALLLARSVRSLADSTKVAIDAFATARKE